MSKPSEISITGSTTLKQMLEKFDKIDATKTETAGRRYLSVKLTIDASAQTVLVGTSPDASDKAAALDAMPSEFVAMLAKYERLAKEYAANRNAGRTTEISHAYIPSTHPEDDFPF